MYSRSLLKQIHPTWIDIRSLIIFRIGIGLYLLYDIYIRIRYGRYDIAWYTSNEYLQQSDTPHHAPIHQYWFYRGSVTFQYTMFILTAILIFIIYVVGWSTIPSSLVYSNKQQQQQQPMQSSYIRQIMDGLLKFVIFLLVTSYQNRNMLVHDGSDAFIRHLLFWICFLPLHSNNNNNNTNDNTNNNTNVVISGLPCFAILLQIVLMYLGTVCQRTIDRYPTTCFTWEYGLLHCPESEWMIPSLSAVHYAISGDFATRDNIITHMIRTIPILSKIMTFQAMIVEGIIPIICLFFVPYNKRHYPACILFLLHFGLYLSLRLPNWQFIGMITQLLWFPGTFWDNNFLPRLVWYFRTKNSSNNQHTKNNLLNDYATIKKTDGDSPTESIQQQQSNNNDRSDNNKVQEVVKRTLQCNFVSKILQYFWFGYMIYNFMGERYKPLLRFENGDIGEGIRLMQHWVMYGSVDHTAHNTFVTGTILTYHNTTTSTPNDNKGTVILTQYIDIFQFVQTRNVSQSISRYYPTVTTNIINIPNVSDTFPSPRWERAIAGMASTSYQKRTQDRIRTFCTTLCQFINYDLQQQQQQQQQNNGDHYYYLKEIEMRFQHLVLLPPGSTERYNLRNRAKPDTFFTIPCTIIPPIVQL